jgi:hypothetical protein
VWSLHTRKRVHGRVTLSIGIAVNNDTLIGYGN